MSRYKEQFNRLPLELKLKTQYILMQNVNCTVKPQRDKVVVGREALLWAADGWAELVMTTD